MKLFSMLALIVLSVVSQGFASEGISKATKASDAVAALVKNKIHYPSFLKKEGVSKTQVLVTFKVNENGSLNIVNTSQTDERVKNYVMDQMQNINIQTSDFEVNELYYLKLNFQLL